MSDFDQRHSHLGNQYNADTIHIHQSPEYSKPPDKFRLVPYMRNLFFTGREEYLRSIRTTLTNQPFRPLALCGLGGVGKTQIALEYAYHHESDYDVILWVNANTYQEYLSQLMYAARALHIIGSEEQDQDLVARLLFSWLDNRLNWLLIVNNADNIEVLQSTFPTTGRGHILFTTRMSPIDSLASLLHVPEMTSEEGKDFLLKRTNISLEDTQASIDAQTLVALLGALPLALEHAGAYIKETDCSISEYISFYQLHRKELLKETKWLNREQVEPVATTWTVSFERVQQSNVEAVRLLRACAFLAPDEIPENLFLQDDPALSLSLIPLFPSGFELTQALKELSNYSLIRRQTKNHTFSLHRLVQIVIKDELDQATYQEWMEQIISLLEHHFSWSNVTNWLQCKALLPHALEIIAHIQQEKFFSIKTALLLSKTGRYLSDQNQYKAAEPLLQRALAICEQILSPEHPNNAAILNTLAALYVRQGKYEQAEPLLQRALAICEQTLGPEHPDTALTLNNLALLYVNQGKYEQAEPLYQRALAINEQVLGSEHPDTVTTLNNLATLYKNQGKYEQAEPLLHRALAINEQVLGSEHLDTALTLNNLATLYVSQGKYEQAEPLYQRALAINEQVLGSEHPDTATNLNNLASLYKSQGKYEQAEPLYQRALAIREQVLGHEHPDTAAGLNNLADLYEKQGKYKQAEPLYQRALAIREQVLGHEHPGTALSLNNLAALYKSQGKYKQAEPLYRRALAINEQVLGPKHPGTALTLNNLAALYKSRGKYKQAEPLYQRALAIREQVLGSEHPDTVASLNNLAHLYEQQGKYEQAEPLYQRALAIREQVLGSEHPDTVDILFFLANLYMLQEKSDLLIPLLPRLKEHMPKQ